MLFYCIAKRSGMGFSGLKGFDPDMFLIQNLHSVSLAPAGKKWVNDFFGHQSNFRPKNGGFLDITNPKSIKPCLIDIKYVKPIKLHEKKMFQNFHPGGSTLVTRQFFQKTLKIDFCVKNIFRHTEIHVFYQNGKWFDQNGD